MSRLTCALALAFAMLFSNPYLSVAQSSPSAGVSFTVRQRPAPAEKPAPPKFKKFWPAVQAADWADARRLAAGTEWEETLNAFSQLRQGFYAEAETAFQALEASTPHEKLRGLYRRLHHHLLFLQGKWPELAEEDTNNVMIQAFARIPGERFGYSGEKGNEYPLRISTTGCPMAEVKINGNKYWFWLDTGASLSVISSRLAEAAGVVFLEGEADIATSTSAKARTGFAYADSLEMGPYRLYNHPVLVMDTANLQFTLDDGRQLRIDGIVGWNALMRMRLELHYGKGYYRILDESYDAPRNFFWMGYPIVELQSETGVPLAFGLDSGSANTSLSAPIFGKLKPKKVYRDTIKVGGAAGFEQYETRIAPKTALQVGKYLFELKDVREEREEHAFFFKLDGTIGSDLARGGVMVVDFPGGRFGVLPEGG
ncbi:MAG: retropepsin-like domain-containing protein [Phaeodactylibacter sp.]|nr:retropepsin-like domain-containing protein [Phaeodactylibacter sp.]